MSKTGLAAMIDDEDDNDFFNLIPKVRDKSNLAPMYAISGAAKVKFTGSSLRDIFEWCEAMRDVYETTKEAALNGKGKHLTVSALLNAIAHEVKHDEALHLQDMIRDIYYDEYQEEKMKWDSLRSQKPPQQSQRSGTVLVADTKKVVTQGAQGGKRYNLFGHPITAILRWMGREGWNQKQAKHVLKEYGIECGDSTIPIQLRAGANKDPNRGIPATLTKEQEAELRSKLPKE